MNTTLIIANVLTFLAFFVHTFVGDKEIKIIEPKIDGKKQQIWTLVRCGWHWISFDLLFASIGLGLINFTDFFENKNTLLQILAAYFFGYAIAWLITIFISKSFSKNYLKLGQWILLLSISGLIYWGIT